MLKLTAPDQIHIFTISYCTRIRKISTRIRNYFIQNVRIRSPALVQKHETIPENLEE
jgi:hypothetical protein